MAECNEDKCRFIEKCPFVNAAKQYGASTGLAEDSAAAEHYKLSCLQRGRQCDTVNILEREGLRSA